MEMLVDAMRSVAIFLLFTYLVTNLFSGSQYQKYVHYVISLMVIVLLCRPVLHLLTEEDNFTRYLQGNLKIVEDDEFRHKLKLVDKNSQSRICKTYKQGLEESIGKNDFVQKVKVDLDKEGKVKQVNVTIPHGSSPTQVINMLSQTYGIEKGVIAVEVDGTAGTED